MWTRRARPLALFVAVALAAAACAGSSESGSGSPAADGGDGGSGPVVEVRDLRAERLGGGEVDGASLAGTDTVLWFWAPWCTVCRAEAPDVVAAAEAAAGEVRVIGVAGRGEVAEMEAFVADTGTGSLEHLVDADGSIWSEFGVIAQPAFAFVDDSGTVEVHVGSLGEDALTERIRRLAEA